MDGCAPLGSFGSKGRLRDFRADVWESVGIWTGAVNPIVDNVEAAFARVPTRARAIAIDRRGIVLPAGGHFQGIQRIGGHLVIPSSSSSVAYFVVCDLAHGGRALRPFVVAPEPLHHAGGCQIVGEFLAVGVEDTGSRERSEIRFWNLRNPAAPRPAPSLTIQRRGPAGVSTAGAIGMIVDPQRGATLSVATWDANTIDFYTAQRNPFGPTRAQATPGFTLHATWSRDASGWKDDEQFGRYQNANLVAQRDGRVFLVGFYRNRSGDDRMDLYEVRLAEPPARMLTRIASKHMICTAGCNFQHGAGIHVTSPRGFDVYAVNGYSGDHRTGETIHVNHFAAGD